MDLTPKQSTPWWALLKCCRSAAATTQEEEEASDMPINDDEPRTPVVKRCTTIATPPTDKLTPLKPINDDDESSHVTLNCLDNDDFFDANNEFNFESPTVAFHSMTTKVDFAGIGMFLTLAAAAQQASTIRQQHQLHGVDKRSLFDDSFDLKEVVCENSTAVYN